MGHHMGMQRSTDGWLFPEHAEGAEGAEGAGNETRPGTLRDRARVLAELGHPGRIFAGVTAAWLYLGGEAPAPATAYTASYRVPHDARIHATIAQVPPGEAHTLWGARVTTPTRTLTDLYFANELGRMLELLRTLTALHPVRVVDAIHPANRGEQTVKVRSIAHLEREL